MIPYLTTSMIAFFLLAFAWSKDGWANFFVKVGLCSLAIWSGFLLTIALGFVVKA